MFPLYHGTWDSQVITAAYDKQYLEGRYGADPYLSNRLTGGRLGMSLKPLKKSDLEKGWMKKRRDKTIRYQIIGK